MTRRRITVGIGLAAFAMSLLAVPAAATDTGSAKQTASAVAPMTVIVVPSRRVPQTGLFIPPKVGVGDNDFAAHGPRVVARAFLNGAFPGSKTLSADICLHAKETVADFTEVFGCSTESTVIFHAPVGECIQSVGQRSDDVLEYIDTDHAIDEFPGQLSNAFVRTWQVTGETNSIDVGRTGANFFTQDLLVTSAPC